MSTLIQKKTYTMQLKQFQDYAWSFYAPGEVFANFFKESLTREEMDAACLLISKADNFEGDTFDREKARDLILKGRGEKTEYFG